METTCQYDPARDLKEISELKDNWDQEGAPAFSSDLIKRCENILNELKEKPSFIAPTAEGYIRFVYIGEVKPESYGKITLPSGKMVRMQRQTPIRFGYDKTRYLEFKIFLDSIKFTEYKEYSCETIEISLNTADEMDAQVQTFYSVNDRPIALIRSTDDLKNITQMRIMNTIKFLRENSVYGIDPLGGAPILPILNAYYNLTEDSNVFGKLSIKCFLIERNVLFKPTNVHIESESAHLNYTMQNNKLPYDEVLDFEITLNRVVLHKQHSSNGMLVDYAYSEIDTSGKVSRAWLEKIANKIDSEVQNFYNRGLIMMANDKHLVMDKSKLIQRITTIGSFGYAMENGTSAINCKAIANALKVVEQLKFIPKIYPSKDYDGIDLIYTNSTYGASELCFSILEDKIIGKASGIRCIALLRDFCKEQTKSPYIIASAEMINSMVEKLLMS